MNGKETTMTEEIRSKAPRTKRSAWYLLTGLVLGLIIGLVFSLLISPLQYEHTDPSTLKDNDKETYRLMIAQVFAATGDLERARFRLALLGDEDAAFALGAQAQRALANGQSEDARALALMASALQFGGSTPTSAPDVTSTPTINPIATQTLPALTPIP
jgi:hypothetical protein